ncbi:MAG TPA: ABC transporter permease subunit [Solirubrobacteraceae bacterium]|nr:ABC transporter permease subunit [Solirubrobacteraceae bacterium]
MSTEPVTASTLAAPVDPGAAWRRRVMATRPRLRLSGVMALLLGLLLVVPIGAFLLVAVMPSLFAQGNALFTLSPFATALSGSSLHALGDTALVGAGSALVAVACGLPLALLIHRTNVIGRRMWTVGIWALLLAPSYLVALGWERLFEPGGVLVRAGIDAGFVRGLLYGPVGVIGVDGIKGVPFAYLAIAAALPGLGSSFEHAARVHGAGRLHALRTIVPIIAPAIWTSLAIVFAESISDFGVAATLAYDAHFPVSTFALFNAVDNEPISFPLAAAIGCTLVALAGLALLAQRRALRGRSYQVLSGRTRPYTRHHLRRRGQLLAGAGAGLFFLIALGVPVFGAVSASLLKGLGTQLYGFSLTLENYRRVITSPDLYSPLLYSLRLALIVATVVMLLSVPVARLLTRRAGGRVAGALDYVLLGAVALPSIVMAAGYILVYNLPVMHSLGIALYGTTGLLAVGYVAGALPNNARILIGPLAQLHETLLTSARTHGAGGITAWRRVGVPVLSRFIVWVWLYCFAGTLLELPISELLYPPSQFPLSVAIERRLSTYDFAGGTAMEVVAVLGALLITGVVLGLYRLLTPRGWRNVGATT